MTTVDPSPTEDRLAAVLKGRDRYHEVSAQLARLMSQGRPLTPSEAEQADELITRHCRALEEWHRAVGV